MISPPEPMIQNLQKFHKLGPIDALYQNYTIGLALPLRDFIQACT